jgi:hypothetical protein
MDNWTLYHPPFWKSVTLIDGSKSRETKVMRRQVNDEWQYRSLTPDEMQAFLEADCW